MKPDNIDLDENLVGIAIGIRFRANFAIDDQLGRIVDTILYQKGSYFNSSLFSSVQSDLSRKTLLNPKTQDKLIVDNSNIILDFSLKRGGGIVELKNVSEIMEKFESQIILGIMKEFKIREINRLGIVKSYLFRIEELAKVFIDKTVGHTLQGVNDINLSFSKKITAPSALVDRDIRDYSNAIFNVIKVPDRSDIFMSIDFQKYFDPFLPAASEIKFGGFLGESEAFIRDRYLPWIKSNYVEA